MQNKKTTNYHIIYTIYQNNKQNKSKTKPNNLTEMLKEQRKNRYQQQVI